MTGKAFLTKTETIVSAKNPSELDNPDTTLAALKDSTSQYFVESLIPEATLVTIRDYDEGVNMVIQDEVDAMVADYPICVVSLLRYPDAGLLSIITPLTYEPLGIALPADDAHFINWVDNFLMVLEGSGNMELMKKQWFEDGLWLRRLP